MERENERGREMEIDGEKRREVKEGKTKGKLGRVREKSSKLTKREKE